MAGRSEPRSGGCWAWWCSNTPVSRPRAPQLSIAGCSALLHPDNSLLTACQESGTGTSFDCCECSTGIHCINFLNQVDLIVFQLYFATPSSITARWLWLLFGKIYLVVIIVTDPDTYHIQNQSRHSQTFDTGHSTMDGWSSAGNITTDTIVALTYNAWPEW